MGLIIIYTKYLLFGVIFILTSINGSGSLPINININSADVMDHNENLTICIRVFEKDLHII